MWIRQDNCVEEKVILLISGVLLFVPGSLRVMIALPAPSGLVISIAVNGVIHPYWKKRLQIKPQYKEVLRRTHIFKINCCLKVYNAHLKS